MENLDAFLFRDDTIIDAVRRVKKPPNMGLAWHRCSHQWKTRQQIHVIEKCSCELFRFARVPFPGPCEQSRQII